MNKKTLSSKTKKVNKVKVPVEKAPIPDVIESVQISNRPTNQLYILAGIFLASAVVAGSLTNVVFRNIKTNKDSSHKTQVITIAGEQILKNEHIDPYALFTANRALESKYELVDLRDADSYKKEHIKKSVHIPFDKGSIDLSLVQKSKHIILYSYTDYSSESEQVMSFLQNKGYSVSILKTGWNTFRHFSNLWIPERKWGSIRVDDYIESDNT